MGFFDISFFLKSSKRLEFRQKLTLEKKKPHNSITYQTQTPHRGTALITQLFSFIFH